MNMCCSLVCDSVFIDIISMESHVLQGEDLFQQPYNLVVIYVHIYIIMVCILKNDAVMEDAFPFVCLRQLCYKLEGFF